MSSFTTNAIAVRFNGKIGIDVEYTLCEQEVLKTVPAAHNRVVRDKTEQLYKDRILSFCYGDSEVNPGDWVYYIHKENLGNREYPYMIESVKFSKIKSIGEKVCTLSNGDRPYRDNVIAVFTGSRL